MSYQIDQSGKIEQTNRHSVIALTNGDARTVLLKKKEKRKLQEVFKIAGQQKYFPYLVFAVLIALAVKELRLKHTVLIDQEYFGHHQIIEQHIILYLNILEAKTIPPFEFGHVGKLSRAHQIAYEVATEKNLQI